MDIMNTAGLTGCSKELNDAISKVMESQTVHLTSRFRSARGVINLSITNKEKIKIILEQGEFLHFGDTALAQEYIDVFYLNTTSFLLKLNEFLAVHQYNTSQMIEKETGCKQLLDFNIKSLVIIKQTANRLINGKKFRHEVDEISFGFAVISRIIKEVDDIIGFYELNKDDQEIKGIPELLVLLKDLRYSFQNLLRSQKNYHNSICDMGEINFGIISEKITANP